MTLHEDLQSIDGVGPATADKIVRIVEAHEPDAPDLDEDALADAIDQAWRGNEGAVIAYLEGLR